MFSTRKFSSLLRKYGDANNLEPIALAEHLKVPAATLYKWLDGKHIPKSNRLRTVCHSIGASLDEVRVSAYRAPAVPSIDDLQLIFSDRLQNEPVMSYEVVGFAGTVVQSQLIQHGVKCEGAFMHNGAYVIHTLDSEPVYLVAISGDIDRKALTVWYSQSGAASNQSDILTSEKVKEIADQLLT